MIDSSEDGRYSGWAAGIRASDPFALEGFFRDLHPALVRYAASMVDPDSAEDLVQDAFVKIWETRTTIDPRRSIKAFAYQTVRNLCLNRIRDQGTRKNLLEEERPTLGLKARDPEEDLSGRDLAAHLTEWIDELPDRQREALRLSRFEGLSHQEVADAMGVSARTVNNHLVKALRSIRDRVESYEPSLLRT